MSESGPPRRGRPSVPDEQVIDGARQALIANPSASMAEIGRVAGVGMSALYARFDGRESLLRWFAAEGNRDYAAALDRVDERFRRAEPASRVLREFMNELVVADHHQVWLGIAGTFDRTDDDLRDSVALRRRGNALVRRCHDEGALREGVTWRDLFKAQEMLSAVQGATPARTRNLRLRLLDVVFAGLSSGPPLPGSPPRADDVAENRFRAG